jgi:Nucleotidyl transferase AbiEii toxin, Type IV TA system
MIARQPDANDLVLLTQALTSFGVEYALIGGTAMAVHGFSRATKDIDLLLPVDAENNARLLQALASIPGNAQAMTALRREWMDKGHSTALEGEIFVDLLYVAASQSFESLKSHVQTVLFNGVPVVTLDVDGMLLTKKTSRESDIPDRLKLERLRNALRAQAAANHPEPKP